jgi:hypothetical protein
VQAVEAPDVAGTDRSLYRHMGTLEDGDHFGEKSCILGLPSSTAVVSRTFSKCLSLRGIDLDAIVALHMNCGQDKAATHEGVLSTLCLVFWLQAVLNVSLFCASWPDTSKFG